MAKIAKMAKREYARTGACDKTAYPEFNEIGISRIPLTKTPGRAIMSVIQKGSRGARRFPPEREG
jgi:hypothetical protein